MNPRSALEQTLAWQVRAAGLPTPCPEYLPIPGRKFRFDFAWPELRLLVEVQGGVWNGGKHGRGSGILKDQEKLNLATLAGWRILQVSENHITNGQAILWIRQAIERPPLAPP